jgi:hypothetical protein
MELGNHVVASRMFRRLLVPTINLPQSIDCETISRLLTVCTVRRAHGGRMRKR